jgi:hypothetical protein
VGVMVEIDASLAPKPSNNLHPKLTLSKLSIRLRPEPLEVIQTPATIRSSRELRAGP